MARITRVAPHLSAEELKTKLKLDLEAQVGHEVHKSTISRLLQRHGWRKPMPRPVHPQASAEVQEQFKKTSQPALRLPSRPVQQRTHDPS